MIVEAAGIGAAFLAGFGGPAARGRRRGGELRLDRGLDCGDIDLVGVLAVDGLVADDRRCVELQVLAAERVHLGREVEQIPARVRDQVLVGRAEQAGELPDSVSMPSVLSFQIT